ncbi:MAG: hypothetical protein ACYTG6_17565 [Planctomycetota bacterium]|jgi:tetratricopeptide (TPR) repeat protein
MSAAESQDDALSLRRQAWAHATAGEWEPGLAAMRRSLEVFRTAARQPDLLEAHCELGRFLLDAGDLDGAESSIRNAIQQARILGDDLALGTALLWLGRTLARTDRRDRALLAFTEAVPFLAAAASPLAEEARAELLRLNAVPGGFR